MLAVKFYSTMPQNNENVLKGIDGKIPAIVIDMEIFPNEHIDETFSLMTTEDYRNYLQSIKNELASWECLQATL